MGKTQKTHAEFVREIQAKFNGNIVVLGQYVNQKTKIEFYCNDCENRWHAAPMSILKTFTGCPECAKKIIRKKLIVKNINTSGRFVDLYPDLVEMLDCQKNNDISIADLSPHSGQCVSFKCTICGYSWRSKIANMVKNKGNCPQCYRNNMTNNVITYRLNKNGSLADHYPELLSEWDYDKNLDTNPDEVLIKSNKKVWWKCQKCGREWQAKIAKRTAGEGCPHCYRFEKSNLQQKVQNYIENKYGQYDFVHEYDCSLQCRNPNTNRILPYDNELVLSDNSRLIIECHGEQHYRICGLTKLAAKKDNITPEEALKYVQWKDTHKEKCAISNGYYYLAIPYDTESDESYKSLIDNKIQQILNKTQCA